MLWFSIVISQYKQLTNVAKPTLNSHAFDYSSIITLYSLCVIVQLGQFIYCQCTTFHHNWDSSYTVRIQHFTITSCLPFKCPQCYVLVFVSFTASNVNIEALYLLGTTSQQ